MTGHPSTFFSLYHVNLVILGKTAISPVFRNFCYCLQTWIYLKKGNYSNEDNVLPQRFLFDDLNYSLRQIYTLSPPPFPSKPRTGKWRVLAFARLHLWFGERGWKFAVPFYSVQDCSPLSSRHHCLVFENSWENGAENEHDFYPLKIFHLFGFPSWKSELWSENYRDQNLPFQKFQPEKRLPKILGDLFGVKIIKKWAIILHFRCSKMLREAGKQEILQQMFRKFEISNRLPNRYFQKIGVGCPWVLICYRSQKCKFCALFPQFLFQGNKLTAL